MTVNSAAWNPADHPRDAGSGKFSAKAFRDPEAVLVENAAAGVLVPVLDDVPYHQRVAEQGNPILTAYRRAQAEGGATAREWLDAIDTYFDDPETAPRGGVYDHVRDLFGRPEDESDVDGWFGRTNDWRAQPEQALHAELQFTDLAEVPSHSNDSGDWCPYSETMQIGGQWRVVVHSRDAARRADFAARIERELGTSAVAVATAREAVSAADAVIVSTTSRVPVLEPDWLAPGTHVNSTGPKFLGGSELPAELASVADTLVSDSPQQALHDREPWFAERAPDHLGAVLADALPGRRTPGDLTLYCSTGLAGTEVLLAEAILGGQSFD